ncbi:tape measure protein, partial [Patescibacteria group bacterium]|nr:tape measure protein [Patescibacteria group bacterium]
MATTPNSGVYNFLINMSINFKSTSKTSAVIGNSLRKLKKDADNLLKNSVFDGSQPNGQKISANIKQISNATSEASKRASYFDTVWGKAFGVIMKFYTIRFFAKMFIDIGKAVYNATVNIGKFDQKLLGLYGHSAEGSKALGNVYKLSEQYGSSLDRTAEIMKKTSRYAKLLGSDMTEALVKMNQSFAYGEDTVNAIIEAFARMRDTGKVSISDMNELAENGLYVWEELRDKLGLTDEQLRTIEKSSIDVNSVMKILSDYIIKVSNEETTKVNDLAIAIGRLKTDFKKFTDAITQSIGDNIFVKIINWCDEIIRRLSRIILIASGKSGNEKIAEMQQKAKSGALTNADITVLKNLFNDFKTKNEELINKINQGYKEIADKYSNVKIDEKIVNAIKSHAYTYITKDLNKLNKLTTDSISKILADYGNKVAEALKTGTEIEDLKVFIGKELVKLLGLNEEDNSYSQYISEMATKIVDDINKNHKYIKSVYDENIKKAQDNTKAINQNLTYMEQIETLLSTVTRTTGIRSNQPETVSEKSTSGTSEILLIQNYADKLLEELLYNIEKGITDDINGIMNFLQESMLKYIPGLASELSIGIYNALDKDEILKAFDEISNYIKRIYEKNIEILKAQNASEITIYEYQMEVQQKLLEVEKQKHEYIMQWLNNELQKAVELANKQNEANKNNKFYQTLLA